jgi:hypothetical protein
VEVWRSISGIKRETIWNQRGRGRKVNGRFKKNVGQYREALGKMAGENHRLASRSRKNFVTASSVSLHLCFDLSPPLSSPVTIYLLSASLLPPKEIKE